MPSRFLLHTILLVLATAGVYLWLLVPSLSIYTLQLVAVLVLLYLGSHWLRSKKPKWFHRSTVTLDLTILTSMILLLVTETNGLASPFFFLLYFLLFAVSMLYEIEATLVLTGVLILFLMFITKSTLSKVEGLSYLTQIISLVMITPLAIFTGHQYESTLEAKRLNAELKKHLGDEESDILLFLSLNLKKTLLTALDSLSVAIPAEKVKDVRLQLQALYQDLKNLYRSADELQNTLDRDAKD